MRILHLVLAPRLSGAEVLAKDLAIHQQRGGETVGVTALTPPQADFAALQAELVANGVQCLFPERMYGRVGKLWSLYQIVKGYRADVLFAHATIPAFYARALPLSVPVVYVMHSATNDFERYLFRRVERMLSRRARAVIAVSPANIDDYVGAVGRHPSMTLIPNGVDMARFARRPLAGAEGSAQIVQIGRYTSVKNQLSTVHAFERVIESVPEARLLLCGVIEDPAYHAAVGDLVAKLGLAGAREHARAAFGRGRAVAGIARVRDAVALGRAQHRVSGGAGVGRAGGREQDPAVQLRRRFSRRAPVRSRRYARLRERARDGAARAALAASAWRAHARGYGGAVSGGGA